MLKRFLSVGIGCALAVSLPAAQPAFAQKCRFEASKRNPMSLIAYLCLAFECGANPRGI